MGDHPGFLATNPCHTYKRVSTFNQPFQPFLNVAIKNNKNCINGHSSIKKNPTFSTTEIFASPIVF